MLTIRNLEVSVDAKKILNGVSLTVKPGEIHAIMGPNGSGKSTLSNVIMGHPKYIVTGGEMQFDNEDLTGLAVDKRARRGIFLAFQYPKEIPGVPLISFLHTAFNALQKAHEKAPLSLFEFRKMLRPRMADFSIDMAFLNREMNVGFSGGEKKKVEILQMALLEPRLALLDETDSGLDVDALKTVAEGVNKLRSVNRGMLLITHYQRILSYVQPDFVHVMYRGKIVESGTHELAKQLEKEGYGWIREKYGAADEVEETGKRTFEDVQPIPSAS